ncbi:MAG: hypothetical protein VKJ64_04975 [Leptolyngbyaceae bacterium]|nr:hypothetical protein [Leptolyngbyaceae bacterium]
MAGSEVSDCLIFVSRLYYPSVTWGDAWLERLNCHEVLLFASAVGVAIASPVRLID